MLSQDQSIDVLLLAGDRQPMDPWVQSLGVPGKALIPLGGTPLLQRVLSTLATWSPCRRVVLVSPAGAGYERAIIASKFPRDRLIWRAPMPKLYDSVIDGLHQPDVFEQCGLIVSADHGLLNHAWLDAVCSSISKDVDVSLGMAGWSLVMHAFPEARRTRYRFSDQSLCGGNLFAFKMPAFEKILKVWARVESERKKPWKMLSMLGPLSVAKYLAGRLDSAEAFSRLSKATGTRIKPTIVHDPAVSVDVDSPEDLRLAERILRERIAAPKVIE